MKCRICGAEMNPITTDLPFKATDRTIVIVKGLPILDCHNCTEYVIEDPVLVQVERILSKVNTSAELEIIHFAA